MSRDWNTPPPSGAFPAPAEGLPPCLSIASLDNRFAFVVDKSKCGQQHFGESSRFWAGAGKDPQPATDSCDEILAQHPDWPQELLTVMTRIFAVATDDPDEAQAAFERGAEYVRTGVMP